MILKLKIMGYQIVNVAVYSHSENNYINTNDYFENNLEIIV